MARVIPKDEMKACGIGWLELHSDDITKPSYTLVGCAWFDWNSIEVDENGDTDTGYVKPDGRYGCVGGWRMWDD